MANAFYLDSELHGEAREDRERVKALLVFYSVTRPDKESFKKWERRYDCNFARYHGMGDIICPKCLTVEPPK